MGEIWRMGAAELARRIRRRELSSREVVAAQLERIATINPELNALRVVLDEEALAAAEAVDREIAAGGEPGPLAGVPITVKEGIAVAGTATTHGLAPLASAIAMIDSPVVAELRAAGAIPIARSNMPELGMRWHTDNGLAGPTRSPWHAGRTPGGSSGGEAAAIAAGLSPLGIGSDGAGSLRWPAQCCGVAALKPSHGRVPVVPGGGRPEPIPFAFQLLGVLGPMARRIEDLRLALRHMCSAKAADPWHVVAPFSGPEPAEPVRVALVRDGGRGVDPAIAAALDEAARRLQDAGYAVEERELPELDRANEVYTQVMIRWSRATPGDAPLPPGFVSPDFDRFWAAFGPAWDRAAGETSHDLMMERATLYRAWFDLMASTPLLLAPIASVPAFEVGADLGSDFADNWIAALRTVVPVNLLGLPAVAVPVAVADGLPQVVQLIAPRFREDLCLAVAEAIEIRGEPLVPITPRSER